jgi:hypothetical protein
MQGNNVRCAKVKRILVPLTEASQQGRYQLPDDPDLDKKNIVGLSASFAEFLFVGDVSRDTPYYINGVNLKIPFDSSPLAKQSFLTLYNEKNEIMIENFPLIGLFNRPNPTTNKIFPITGKIKTRQSFVSIAGVTVGLNVFPTMWLNFFYI